MTGLLHRPSERILLLVVVLLAMLLIADRLRVALGDEVERMEDQIAELEQELAGYRPDDEALAHKAQVIGAVLDRVDEPRTDRVTNFRRALTERLQGEGSLETERSLPRPIASDALAGFEAIGFKTVQLRLRYAAVVELLRSLEAAAEPLRITTLNLSNPKAELDWTIQVDMTVTTLVRREEEQPL